ncbi:MAG TPA: hypothetical protein VHB21_06560 [Minicystis sp.]|nr:hypothetical protein [Minicystis sp.]
MRATPLLEQAELTRHRPTTAVALAGCYVAEGELLKAYDVYHALADEKPSRSWKRDDVAAQKLAKKKAGEIDQRIPRLRFEPAGAYEELAVEVDGVEVHDLDEARRVPADKKLKIVARAKGKKELEDELVLHEGERRTYALRLEPLRAAGAAGAPPAGEAKPADKQAGPPRPMWVGARFRGILLPKFIQRLFVDGGRELVGPGGGATFTFPVGDVDLVTSLGYVDYGLGETPFKGKNAPDTEWEIDSSTLKALLLEAGLAWSIPLDADKKWNVRLGGSLGVGWAFAGDLYRTQAYPRNFKPGDPYTYLKCKGPNDPRGSFHYCDTLDKDATHYRGYADADWFHGGLRPTVYPWIVLPEVGLRWRFAERVAAEASFGLSITGFVFGGGLGYAL